MGCCEATNPNLEGVVEDDGYENFWGGNVPTVDRRTALKGLLGIAGAFAVSHGPAVQGAVPATKVRLAFCGQLLCVVPYEVARARGHFAAEGIDIELVYTRGGNAAMQALVGGAVEYAGSSFDVALQAFANGAPVRRFATTGRLPLFALAAAPKRKGVKSVKELEGMTIGVSGLGNADHVLVIYLLKQAGADTRKVRYAALGTNVLEAVRLGQVDAAMVQEPALTLIEQAGGVELVNFMEIEQARKYFGGAYEFMGVAVRAKERDQRLPEMRRLASALKKGLIDTRKLPADDIVAALPKALVAGGDTNQLKQIITRYRLSLYPDDVTIDVAAAERVLKSQLEAEVLKAGAVNLNTLLDTAVLKG